MGKGTAGGGEEGAGGDTKMDDVGERLGGEGGLAESLGHGLVVEYEAGSEETRLQLLISELARIIRLDRQNSGGGVMGGGGGYDG